MKTGNIYETFVEKGERREDSIDIDVSNPEVESVEVIQTIGEYQIIKYYANAIYHEDDKDKEKIRCSLY